MAKHSTDHRPRSTARTKGWITEIPPAFKEYYGPLVDDEAAFYSALVKPLPKSLRVNTLKAEREYVKTRYTGYGIPLVECPWYADALIPQDATVDPSPALEHFLGQVYVQELTSMLPPLALREEIVSANLVLDACAAPGSKATQVAALMNDHGTLIANDADYNRIRALKHNLSKAGAQNVILTNVDLAEFPTEQQFDVILLDAPCSSDGTIRKMNKLLPNWTAKRPLKYASLQRHLIKKAFALLKPDGVMLYSTCSFSPEENEVTVSHLLNNSEAEIEPIEIPNLHLSPGITEWNGELDPRVARTSRIWGHHNNTGGFFLAKIRKTDGGE